ncbi:MAG: HEPN domain-containing protein [Bacteroidaceae bacterium]|nr:HEPN domain-containing protein [Bacteroidaceae bacterium]
MSLNDEERRAVVRLQIEKAHAIFDQIPLLCEAGYWDNVVNRLYYSLFHAVSALLINDGYNVGSHRGAVGAFGQYYVTKGIFTIEDGRHYSRLQGLREKADYNCSFNAQEKDAAPKIEPTRQLIAKIEKYILDNSN